MTVRRTFALVAVFGAGWLLGGLSVPAAVWLAARRWTAHGRVWR